MKTNKILVCAAFLAASFTSFAQVGVGTTSPQAGLDITSDKGMLIPRMADHTTLVPVDGTLDATEEGLQVYNTTTDKVMLWDGAAWVAGATGTGKFVDGTVPTDAVFTGGKVGIGTTMPATGSILHVDGLKNNTSSNPTEIEQADDFVILSDGTVGIGTATPDPLVNLSIIDRTSGAQVNLSSANAGSQSSIQIGNPLTVGSAGAFSFIDFVGDEVYSDYGLRVFRANGENAKSFLAHRGTGNLELRTLDAANLVFKTANIERMSVNANGKVGIGVTTPSAFLDVVSSGNDVTTNALKVTNASGSDLIVVDDSGAITVGTQTGHGNTMRVFDRVNDASLVIGSDLDKNSSLQIGSPTETSAGALAFIDLVGDAVYTDYGFRILRNNTGANAKSVLAHKGTGDFEIRTEEAGKLVFKTANTERININATGNIGIGINNQQEKLHVIGAVRLASTTAVNGWRLVPNTDLSFGLKETGFGDMITLKPSGLSGVNTITLENGNVGIGTTTPTSKLHVSGLNNYASDTAAGAAGLSTGAFYRTGGVVMVKL